MKNRDISSRVLHKLARGASLFSKQCTDLVFYKELTRLSISQIKNVPTHVTNRELNALYNLVIEFGTDINVLEIGSYLGASSCYLAAALAIQNGHLFCVDTWENQTMPEGEYDTFAAFINNTSPLGKYITPIRKNSKNLVSSDIAHPLSLVFLDGDHSYTAIKNDYEKVAPWLLEGGILAFHDCFYFEGVSRTIGEALATGNWQISGYIDNLLWLRKLGGEHFTFVHPMQ